MEHNQNTEIEVIRTVEDTALYLLTKAEIDTAMATARAFPRSLTKFIRSAMSMATLTEDIAASCSYALPRGGKTLEGPSIRLAEIVASAYGNIRFGGRIVANDGKWVTAQAVCIDVENNVTCTIEVLRKITDKNGLTFTQDMQVVTGNAASKIAIRNAILTVIPSALIADIYEKAKEVARGTAETLKVRREKAVSFFTALNVTEKQICDALEIKDIGDIDLDKMVTLSGMKASIKNGEATIQTLFESVADNKKAETDAKAKAASDALADKIEKDKRNK